MENNELMESKKDKKIFFKGILFGIMLTVCLTLCAKSLMIIYRFAVKKEINYETKTKLIYNTMKKNYVDEIDKKDMYEGMYAGMVFNTTDKYSTYIPASAYDEYQKNITGNYVGIGVMVFVNENDMVQFKTIYENSPAEKADIHEGDIITEVDGTKVDADNYDELIDMIQGEEGSVVKLKIYRPSTSETMDKDVTRAAVKTPTVSCDMLDDKIGYIRLSGFETVTPEQFNKAFDTLKKDGMDRLIIDLRNNPGGLLTSVRDVLDVFLDKGVITYTEDKYGKKDYVYSEDGGESLPVVILTNGKSASAAELFSAAMHDRYSAKLVGENTYGKGIMQTTFPFSDGSAVKLTTAKYYTPNGVCIDGVGIKPDVEIAAAPDFEMPELVKTKADFAEDDVQLDKAVEVIEGE